MSKYTVTSENTGIRCPYCGYMTEADILMPHVKKAVCSQCKKIFRLSSSVFYLATPDCELNNQKHEWSWEIEPGFKQCLICGKGKLFESCPLIGDECDRADEQVGDLLCDGCQCIEHGDHIGIAKNMVKAGLEWPTPPAPHMPELKTQLPDDAPGGVEIARFNYPDDHIGLPENFGEKKVDKRTVRGA